jgi:hypothetical protein
MSQPCGWQSGIPKAKLDTNGDHHKPTPPNVIAKSLLVIQRYFGDIKNGLVPPPVSLGVNTDFKVVTLSLLRPDERPFKFKFNSPVRPIFFNVDQRTSAYVLVFFNESHLRAKRINLPYGELIRANLNDVVDWGAKPNDISGWPFPVQWLWIEFNKT